MRSRCDPDGAQGAPRPERIKTATGVVCLRNRALRVETDDIFIGRRAAGASENYLSVEEELDGSHGI